MDAHHEHHNEDDRAMVRLAGGDDPALGEIMARWAAPLISFLFRMTRDMAAAEDLAQETFVRLYQSRDRYRPGGAFSCYIFQIAANLARNLARWKTRHPEESLDAAGGDILPGGGTDPREGTSGREVAADIQTAIAALPEDLRLPLVLAVYHDMSRNQVAATLGCTPKAAEMRLYRARQALRISLAKHLE